MPQRGLSAIAELLVNFVLNRSAPGACHAWQMADYSTSQLYKRCPIGICFLGDG